MRLALLGGSLALTAALGHEATEVREAAVGALTRIGRRKRDVVPALRRRVKKLLRD